MTTLLYPITAVNGSLILTKDDGEAIEGAVKSAVLTQQGERVLRPTYGTDPQLFELVSDFGDYIGDIETDVDNSLTDYTTVLTKLSGSIVTEGTVNILLQYTTEGGQPEALEINV